MGAATGVQNVDVAIIIPAYNEGTRLAPVLRSLEALPPDWERLVVNDGSTDDTAAVARSFPEVRLLDLPENQGKGAAMWAGAAEAQADTLIFLDADLRGLRADHVRDLAAPVLAGEAEMTIGLFRGGRGPTDFSHVITPWVSGQRCIHRDRFLAVGGTEHCRHGVEMLLTHAARKDGWRVTEVTWPGVTHTMKEEKLGVLRGHLARWRMYGEMARSFAATYLASDQRRLTRSPQAGAPVRRRD